MASFTLPREMLLRCVLSFTWKLQMLMCLRSAFNKNQFTILFNPWLGFTVQNSLLFVGDVWTNILYWTL
jgi:hypothetical protein